MFEKIVKPIGFLFWVSAFLARMRSKIRRSVIIMVSSS